MAGVYISYPFCAQKCSYCNFASGVLPAALEGEYIDALHREIARQEWKWRPETVYLGGGTPSRMEPSLLRGLLAEVPGAPWVEATIEAAPGSVTQDAAVAWREAGINRVSLGVQSFVTKELAQTGRRHTAEVVEREIGTLRRAGMERVNIDLIAGLPFQTRESWIESLAWSERLRPDHVSVYMLEVDEDSRLGIEIIKGGSRYGAAEAPSEGLVVELYELAVERLAGMGIRRYEISNFARPGFESRHNLKYWRLEPYVGFGADAHSFDGRLRWQNAESPAEYVRRMREDGSACMAETPADTTGERFFVGLRLRGGVSPTEEEWRRFGEPIRRFVDQGLMEIDGGTLRLSNRGVLLSNEVFEEFIV
jgi:oxygen-independent coproporphyrinogen-3 oxidase